MSCDRCSDIHKAQLNGKTNEECKCKCHKWSGNSTWPSTSNCTCNIVEEECPIHGFPFQLNTCTSDGACSVINFNNLD